MRSGERSPAAVINPIRRRQPERLICQLGRLRRRAAIVCQRGGVIEPTCNLSVRRVGRECDVAGGEDRVVDDLGDTGVNAPSLFAQVGVQHRRQQRVGEADHPVLALDHARATAASSASAATPARSRSDTDVVPTAAAKASALRVDAGSAEILALTSSSSVSGTASG